LALTVIAAGLIAWALIGELGEAGGSDYIVRLPQGSLVPGIAGALVAAAAIGWALALPVPSRARLRRPSLLAAAAGGWGAFALRVVSAPSHGANIGGGLLVLVGPIVFLTLLGAAVAATVRSA
jgi:hypothetical protein